MPIYGTVLSDLITFPKQYKITSEFKFLTDIIETGNGAEDRKPNWLEHLTSLSFESLVFENCYKKQLETFKTFFIESAQGCLNAFRFQNPVDYKVTRLLAQHGVTTSSQGVVVYGGDNDAGDAIWWLLKKYTFNGVSSYKTIRYPIESTLLVWQDNLPITNHTMHPDGYLTIPNTTALNIIEFEGEYDRLYRFAEDNLNIQRPNAAYFSINGLRLDEVTNTAYSIISPADFVEDGVVGTLDLGFNPTYTDTISMENFRKLTKNNRELVERRFTENKQYRVLDGTILKCTEKDNLICMFLACKGRLLKLQDADENEIRFDTDSIKITKILDGDICCDEVN